MKKTLFLCKTPLQARICLAIIEQKSLKNPEVIYSTQHNSGLDRRYFFELQKKTSLSTYLFFAPKKHLNILNYLYEIKKLYSMHPMNRYDSIYLASIDNLLFRFIIKKNPQATLYGFDDGTANITPSSHYFNPETSWKLKLYRKLLGVPSASIIKLSIKEHYSLYPNFQNIISASKIIPLTLTLVSPSGDSQRNSPSKSEVFFIGQPFAEYLDRKDIEILKAWLANQSIDFYIKHPRESQPITPNIPLLQKNELLAEDAIFEVANGRPIIISAYSTVLFNVSSEMADKIYLSIANDEEEQRRLALIKKTGSTIIKIGQQ